MKLAVYLPLSGATITQGFSKNFNTYYAESGLLGHSGIDFVSYSDDQIKTVVDGAYTYKIVNKDNPDLSKYRCVFQIGEFDEGVFEISYGHCNDIHCQHGLTPAGTNIATMGNTGNVFVGGREITTAEKKAGSKAGTHVHVQFRKVQKVTSIRGGYSYLTGEDGEEFVKDGFMYEIVDHNNGFNGCVDFEKYLVQKVAVAERTTDPSPTEHYDTPYKPVPAPIYKKGQVVNWIARYAAILFNGLKDFYKKK